jgi:alkylhydroperoxidase family enzyme
MTLSRGHHPYTRGHVPDEAYEAAEQQFTDEELVNLTWAAIAINGWNRVAIAFRSIAGEYQPQLVR